MLSLPLGHELVIIKREFENDLIPECSFLRNKFVDVVVLIYCHLISVRSVYILLHQPHLFMFVNRRQ